MSSGNPTVRQYLETAKTMATEAIAGLPAANRGLLGTCVAAYVVNLLFVDLWSLFGLNVDSIVGHWQVYRLFTYNFIHPILLGLIINTLVLLPVLSRLERALGTLPAVWVLLVVFGALSALIFVAVATVLNGLFGASIGTQSVPVGLGAVFFACLMWISSQDGAGDYNLFGRYTIQAAHFPWLLFAVSALLSGFDYMLLHGAAMAVGYLYAQGKLDIITPSPDLFLRAETETRMGRWIASNARNFIGVDAATGLQATLSGWLPVWTADVSDAQERGAASSPSAGPSVAAGTVAGGGGSSGYQTGGLSGEGTGTGSFPGQGQKLGA